ncbi:MAG: hypothetical protein JW936_03760 [Sedimentisphaerales bacterium]|nr:hypothetical protein [Sedimentisphaerales bacterium]
MAYTTDRQQYARIAASLLLLFTVLVGCVDGQNITATAAFQNRNVIQYQFPAEGNDQINAAKQEITSPGSMVYFYLANTGAEPIELDDIRWAGANLQTHTDTYQAVWHRMMPNPLLPGQEAEVALCLRTALTETTEFVLAFSNGTELNTMVDPDDRDFRIQTLRFNSALDKAYLYVQRMRPNATLPETVYVNGTSMPNQLHWLNNEYCDDLRIAEITFDQPLLRGTVLTFRVASADGTTVDATTIRALSDRAVFGTYGEQGIQRFAENGLTGYNSFRQTSAEELDHAAQLDFRILALAHGQPNTETIGHPALYGFGMIDEPDVRDYGATDRPMHMRIGTNAPQMVAMEAATRTADPLTATTLTVDLTFTPYNYFIYAPITDIANPDCYAITVGWSIRETIKFASTMRMASAPNPFTFTYQGCWEEYAIPQNPVYIPGSQVRANGYDYYRDPCQVRGLGRKPVPSEVRIPMLYAVGCGATGLWSFTDASCVYQNLMFHGSDELPELWEVIGRTSRQLQSVAPLISISHSTDWAASDSDDIWLRTLYAGREWALVIAVNDAYNCTPDGFEQSPANNVSFHFDNLPWLSPQLVYRVDDGNFTPIPATQNTTRLNWTDTITDGEIYLIGTNTPNWTSH